MHLEVHNVPGRDCILLHPFNDALKQSKGCIAPVMIISEPGKGSQSRMALDKILRCVSGKSESSAEVFLTIKKA